MATKALTINKKHLHPLRIYKQGGILEISDEQITVIAIKIVKTAEERVLNELQAIEQSRILQSLHGYSKNGQEA